MVHTFAPKHLGGRGRRISEFEDSQGYTDKPCLEKPKEKKKESLMDLNKFRVLESKKQMHGGRNIWELNSGLDP